MAALTYKYDVFVFPDTPKGSFASSLDFEPGGVTRIGVEIPGGHSGKTGIQIWYGDIQVLPRTADRWFVGNKTQLFIDLEDPFPGGLGWRAEAYNVGKRSHTFYVVVDVDPSLVSRLLIPPVILLRRSGESFPLTTPYVGGETPGAYIPGTPSTFP